MSRASIERTESKADYFLSHCPPTIKKFISIKRMFFNEATYRERLNK